MIENGRIKKSESLLREGIQAGNVGNWEKAIKKIRLAIIENPNNSEARYYLAAAYIALGQWNATKKVAEEGLKIIPDEDIWKGRLSYVLGDALLMLKEDSEAISALKESLKYGKSDHSLDVSTVSTIEEKIKLLQADRGDEIRSDIYHQHHQAMVERKPLLNLPARVLVSLLLGLPIISLIMSIMGIISFSQSALESTRLYLLICFITAFSFGFVEAAFVPQNRAIRGVRTTALISGLIGIILSIFILLFLIRIPGISWWLIALLVYINIGLFWVSGRETGGSIG